MKFEQLEKVAQSGGLLEVRIFSRPSKTVGVAGFKSGCLIDLEKGRPTQMACPLLEWLKNLKTVGR